MAYRIKMRPKRNEGYGHYDEDCSLHIEASDKNWVWEANAHKDTITLNIKQFLINAGVSSALQDIVLADDISLLAEGVETLASISGDTWDNGRYGNDPYAEWSADLQAYADDDAEIGIMTIVGNINAMVWNAADAAVPGPLEFEPNYEDLPDSNLLPPGPHGDKGNYSIDDFVNWFFQLAPDEVAASVHATCTPELGGADEALHRIGYSCEAFCKDMIALADYVNTALDELIDACDAEHYKEDG